MEPPLKLSPQPHSPLNKNDGAARVRSQLRYEPQQLPQGQEQQARLLPPVSGRNPLLIPAWGPSSSPFPLLGEPHLHTERITPQWRDTVGVSFLRVGLFFPEDNGSLLGLNVPLWVSQGHGGGGSNSPA